MGIGTRTLTAVENLIGAISTASKMSKVSFGGSDTNSWMVNLLGALASNTAGRGMDVIGTPFPLGVAASFDLSGAGGGEGYEGDARYRVPLNYTNKAREAVSAVVLLRQNNAALAVTGTPWIRFGYSTDGMTTVTYLTAIAAVTGHTAFAITTAAIPVDAVVFCEISAGAGEDIAGTALIELR